MSSGFFHIIVCVRISFLMLGSFNFSRWKSSGDWLPNKVNILRLLKSESRSVVSNSLWPQGLYSPRNSPGQSTGVGSHSLFQGIFPTQGSNPSLLHHRQTFHHWVTRIANTSYIYTQFSVWWSLYNINVVRSLPCLKLIYVSHWSSDESHNPHHILCDALDVLIYFTGLLACHSLSCPLIIPSVTDF